MGLFRRLFIRLRFGRESPRGFFNKLTLSQLYDFYRDAIPGSPTKARTRAELRNRVAPLKEWVMIYNRSLDDNWAEDLSLRRIRQANATYDEWYRLFLTSPPDSPLKKIAKDKLDSTSRS